MAVSALTSPNNTKQAEDDKSITFDDQNLLQKHVAFFDRNHDGIIYPWETFDGFRAIGCGMFLSTIASIFINVGLSGKTRPGKYFSPLFPIEVKNVHMGKHGSDSGIYDSEGRFVPEKFEEIFTKHARTHHGALTSDELMTMLRANRESNDFKGCFAEWKMLYYLCKDMHGLLHRETIKAAYDGTLFHRLEKERRLAFEAKNVI
ncbi:probable peroxygenase 4 isoform X2 [Carica papaya]|uniref:probable peroxygenase 4 isoform X2 n=1 Tax=Carica papaya TaxID=3649 RepID=UPI000B8CD3F0|nr:probable peroxygenase 4 isoform X2 [Carica papaya]